MTDPYIWNPDEVPAKMSMSFGERVLGLARLLGLATVIYSLLLVLALVRLLEWPFGRRPVSPYVVRLACRTSMWILRLPLTVTGTPMTQKGAVVCNHASWLDIFTLNASQQVFFVSKTELSTWPVIGFIARAAGTVFIARKSRDAGIQKTLFEDRLSRGDRLLFFPEGTSTDTLRVLPFKSTLFAAFFTPDLIETMWIQPSTLVYHAPPDKDPRFYGWWGDMAFLPHFLATLGVVRQGRVELIFHTPVRVSDFKDRKALARYCEETVRNAMVK